MHLNPFRTKRMSIMLTVIFWICGCLISHSKAITIDNQLVSEKNDCFERIVLGSMLPLQSAFRNIDMNSLSECKELCLREVDKCKTIAFGISSRGNGTCQLSSKVLDKSKRRPSGTIFDPDFDLYERRSDCLGINGNLNSSPNPGNFGSLPSDIRPGPGGYPSSPIPGNFPPGDIRPVTSGSSSPPFGTVDTSNSVLPSSTLGSSSTPFNGASSPPADDGYSHPPRPSTFPNDDRNSRPPSSYPSSGYDGADGGGYTRPFETTLSSGQTTYLDRDRDALYFSHDGFPMYKYPMLYEHNYPSPNGEPNRLPATYAPNIPTLEDRYKPLPSNGDYYSIPPRTTPRPVYGLGYGNGYSYGTPVKYGSTRPSYSSYGSSSSDPLSRPTSPYGSDYRPRPTPSYENDRPSTYHPRPPRPLTDTQYAYRPDPDYDDRPTSNEPIGYGSTAVRPGSSSSPTTMADHRPTRPFPDDRPQPGYGTISEGKYSTPTTDAPIETYFNPDDYLEVRWTVKPGNYGSDHRFTDRYPAFDQGACFRRVLAGKRIAPHWVRRTLACERVEDCMQECGHEKRFTCEGFNYRLDPSGHGQGDCELIEVPLAQMDLYSSPRNRDSNLIRHPDYDFYERDRNAPSSCRPSPCTECGSKPFRPLDYYRPDPKPFPGDHYRPDIKPFPDDHFPPSSSGPSGYGPRPDYFRPISDTAIDKYRPSRPIYDSRPPPPPPPGPASYHHGYEGSISSHSSYGADYHGTSFGGGFTDRYDANRPDDYPRPSRWEVQLPTSSGSGSGYEVQENYRPPFRPGSGYSPYREPSTYYPPSSSGYDFTSRDRSRHESSSRFVPYLIGGDSSYGSYGGSYGRGSSYSKNIDYWGLRGENRRSDTSRFNYLDLYGRDRDRTSYNDNFVWSYGGKYGQYDKFSPGDRPNYGSQWTRRPGSDECSVKSGEGFRLHKGIVRVSILVPTITECERMCSTENSFNCHTYSFRYTATGGENCLLCDRPLNLLDYYIDLEPDRNYDIYSMTDDVKMCNYPPPSSGSGSGNTAVSDPRNNNNMQCFFRAIDSTRFFKSIVRDSLTVRSIGECELECIKSSKFTCRAFAFRYGQRTPGGIIDNCQLSDWPVREMDKDRHLILDTSFDVFERASYGHGCELQPIVDEKHKKLCYLGYGSAAKLLPAAIKKTTSVPTELDCKKECIRYRETTPFKCYSFSFGSHASTYNCEMSDLDQTELKLNVHYRHTNNRDYWLFAWNPFDWTCRDKVTTVGGSRVNNDRRMDIFREPGEVTWRHYTVSGKQCRLGNSCEKNLVTGFYSCELEGGEIGSWDYCCKSDHPCGYSKGFEYPWCFVGDELDQWRKCSDRYFPGNNTDTHQGIALVPGDKRRPQHFQRPPRPGGLQSLTDFTVARLWPVTYLYSEGPPNATELSNFVDCNKEHCKRR